MANDDRKATAEEKQQEQLFQRQRQAVNNAYASLQGQSVTDSFAVFTFEEAADAQIERIEGKGSQQHPNLLDTVEKTRNDLARAVEELKTVSPETFLDVNVADSVNTPEDDE